MKNLKIESCLFLKIKIFEKEVIALNNSNLSLTLNPNGSAIIEYEDYNLRIF